MIMSASVGIANKIKRFMKKKKMMSELFRASPSLIVSWMSGYTDQVVQSYFKLLDEPTPAMIEGREWHTTFERWVNTRRRWPLQFDPDQKMPEFINPQTELRLETKLLDWLQLVGVMDLHCENDGGLIIDWKTGKTPASTSLRTAQTGIYALLATEHGLPVRKVGIAHYDQKKRTVDTAYKWVSKALIKEAFETVETVSSEIHSYFQANNFYEAYGEQRAAHYAQREKL